MYGQPAWFGSYSFQSWAGAGEAIPRLVMHEVSHSYWGLFPVEGRPDLSWVRGPDGVAPALAQYRRDLETFMRQPPDRHEPLRDRFRNMPNLGQGDYPDLWHHGEADMVSFTGGDIDLVPPILRKYYSSFLTAHGAAGESVGDWASALVWWRGLSEEQKRTAGEVFGLQHFPLDKYTLPSTSSKVPSGVQATLAGEERQRLRDFADQFAVIKSREFALVDAAGVNRGFSFWRNYLSEMKEMHRKHPEVLGRNVSERARSLGFGLDLYISIERLSPASQAEAYRARSSDPVIRELAVLLKERAVLELFAAGTKQDHGVEAVIGHYAAKLAVTAARADAVLAAGRENAGKGAAELEKYQGSLSDDEIRSDINVIFDLLREGHPALTALIMPGMSDAALLRLLKLQPASARSHEIGSARLLAAVGLVQGVSVSAITAGAKTLAENSSGNFVIDRPYELAVFDLIEDIGEKDPAAAVGAVAESGMRLQPWLDRGSTEMLSIFRREPAAAAKLIIRQESTRTSSQRVVHALVSLDPDLAAALLSEMAPTIDATAGGAHAAARGALLEMAYDAYWQSKGARIGPDPSLDARFVAELAKLRGKAWLQAGFTEAIAIVRASSARGETEQEFESEFRRTLSEAARAADMGTASLIADMLRS